MLVLSDSCQGEERGARILVPGTIMSTNECDHTNAHWYHPRSEMSRIVIIEFTFLTFFSIELSNVYTLLQVEEL